MGRFLSSEVRPHSFPAEIKKIALFLCFSSRTIRNLSTAALVAVPVLPVNDARAQLCL